MFNDKNLKQIRKILRYNQTDPERLLWDYLRNKRIQGYKFFRQYSINNYILDFYCPKLKLNIELDGGQHISDTEQIFKDKIRDNFLNDLNISVLRFSNIDIFTNIQGVLMNIIEKIQNSSQPPLLKRGGDRTQNIASLKAKSDVVNNATSYNNSRVGGIKIPVFVVYGPTASGKTDLAIELAKKNNGELINADSRQIYQYMDIGTNKEIERLSLLDEQWLIDEIPLHLINIITPDIIYNVAEYQKAAYAIINDISKRGKLPIIIGGTGLYIDAVVKGYILEETNIDPKLREELSDLSTAELQNRLSQRNHNAFEVLNESDRSNPRRLIRAIERSYSNDIKTVDNFGHTFSQTLKITWHTPKYEKEELFEKINNRVIEMIDSGLIEEVKKLLAMGYDFTMPAMNTMGYKESGEFLRGEINRNELVQKIQQAHRNYAKKQITWFKKYVTIEV